MDCITFPGECTNCTFRLQDQANLILPTGLQVTVGRPELCFNGTFYPICYYAIINDTYIPQKICSSVLRNVRGTFSVTYDILCSYFIGLSLFLEAIKGAAIGDGSLYTLSLNPSLQGVKNLYVHGSCAPMFEDGCSGLYAVVSCFSCECHVTD